MKFEEKDSGKMDIDTQETQVEPTLPDEDAVVHGLNEVAACPLCELR